MYEILPIFLTVYYLASEVQNIKKIYYSRKCNISGTMTILDNAMINENLANKYRQMQETRNNCIESKQCNTTLRRVKIGKQSVTK